MITAAGYSRLDELRKLKQTTIFTEKYKGGGSFSSDGVDYNISVEDNIVYYINGLRYNDKTNQETGVVETTIIYNSIPSIQVSSDANMYKTFVIDGEYTQPKITNNVFIFRQDITPFKDNYLLEGVSNMEELSTYAGGGYFTIKENS